MGEQPTAYFIQEPAGLVPVPEARSPWAEDMLHGRLLAGLAARALDGVIPGGFRLARLTLDMFRSPPMDPFTVTTRAVRDGRRVKAFDISIMTGEVEIARASALVVAVGRHPDVHVWQPEPWSVPDPEQLAVPDGPAPFGGWDIRLITPGGFWAAGQKQLWARDTWQLVAGEESSPFVRAALAADLPNPLANSGVEGLQFINADLTLTLARPPASDWIGLEVSGHVGCDGIAVGTCTLYDRSGAFGYSTVCAIANAALVT